MKSRYVPALKVAICTIALTLISACGGGGGGQTQLSPVISSMTGVFVDKPVAGLYYETASGYKGYTNEKGEFQYRYVGESVRFSIDGVVPLGTISASPFVHVYDLDKPIFNILGNDNIKRAQLLQTLDSNAGKSGYIKIPSGIAQKISPTELNYSAGQVSFDNEIKSLINQLEFPSSAFISASQAKTEADKYITSVSDVCPVATPPLKIEHGVADQYQIKAGKLTCLDKAKINYYYSSIAPLLSEMRAIGDKSINKVDKNIKDKEAFQKNIMDIEEGVFDSLDAGLDMVIGIEDAAKKGQAATALLSVGAGLGGIVAGVIDTGAALKKLKNGNNEVVTDIETPSNVAKLAGMTIDAIASNSNCTGFTGNAANPDLDKCVEAIFKTVDAIGVSIRFSDLSETEKENLKNSLKIVTDTGKLGAAAFSPDLLSDSSKYIRNVGKATLKLANDSVSLAMKEKIRQQGGASGFGDRAVSAFAEKLMPNLIRLADCLDPKIKDDPLAKLRCLLSQAESTVNVLSNGVVAYYNLAQYPFEAVDTGNAVGNVTNSVVIGAMLEEVLWAGSSGVDAVFTKYGITPSGNADENARNLAIQVGVKRYGYVPKDFAEWIGTLIAAVNGDLIYYVPPTTQDFLYYWSRLNTLVDPNFSMSNVAIDVSPRNDGKIDVHIVYNDGVSNGKTAFICWTPGTVDGLKQTLVEGPIGGFTTSAYAATGSKRIYCDISLDGVNIGKKYVSFELNSAANIPIATSATNVTAGQGISFWINTTWSIVKDVVWNFGADIANRVVTIVNGTTEIIQQAFNTVGETIVSATFRDLNGQTVAQSSVTVAVTSPPLPAAVIANATSDFGVQIGAIANGGTTDDSTPTLSGTVGAILTSGQKINVYDGLTMFNVPAVVNGINWSFTPATPIAIGTHSFTAEVAAFDGTPGTRSAAFVVTVTPNNALPTTLKIPHTGITSSQCYQAGSDALVDCTSSGAISLNSQQDGMRITVNPMSYSLVTNGSTTYSKEECVFDNVRGLIWEGKTATGLRGGGEYVYQPGNSGMLFGVYVTLVNEQALCGFSDWRIPTVDELQTLVDYGAGSPAINSNWFPNTAAGTYMTSTRHVVSGPEDWFVSFSDGSIYSAWRSDVRWPHLRLVRP